MTNQYYYLNDANEAVGPHSMGELLELKSKGVIHDSTLVVPMGSQDWIPMSQIASPSKPKTISSNSAVVMQAHYTGPQAEVLAKYMPLETGESVLCDLQGNAYNVSPNIFARITGLLEKLVSIIFGCPKTAHVIVTDRRVIVIEVQMMFWVYLASVTAKSLMPRSIGSMGYQFARSLIFFRSHYLEFSQGGTATLVKSAEGKDRVYQMIRSIVSLADKVTTK